MTTEETPGATGEDQRIPIRDSLMDLIWDAERHQGATMTQQPAWTWPLREHGWDAPEFEIENTVGVLLDFVNVALETGRHALRGVVHMLMSDAPYGEDFLARPCLEAFAIAFHLLDGIDSDDSRVWVQRLVEERVWGLVERAKLERELGADVEHLLGRAQDWVDYGAHTGLWAGERVASEIQGRRQITEMTKQLFAADSRGDSPAYYRYLSAATHVNVSVLVERGTTYQSQAGHMLHDSRPTSREILIPLWVAASAMVLTHEKLEHVSGLPFGGKDSFIGFVRSCQPHMVPPS